MVYVWICVVVFRGRSNRCCLPSHFHQRLAFRHLIRGNIGLYFWSVLHHRWWLLGFWEVIRNLWCWLVVSWWLINRLLLLIFNKRTLFLDFNLILLIDLWLILRWVNVLWICRKLMRDDVRALIFFNWRSKRAINWVKWLFVLSKTSAFSNEITIVLRTYHWVFLNLADAGVPWWLKDVIWSLVLWNRWSSV